MNNFKHFVPASVMTFSQRKRLINLLWALVSNSVLPFLLGFIFALISVTHSFTETLLTFDKSGLGVCIQPNLNK